MRRALPFPLTLLALIPPLLATTPACAQVPATADSLVRLPKARVTGTVSVEDAITRRRSVRELAETPLRLEELAQIAWAAQGITGPGGKRAAPSAMARYPVDLYLVASRVDGLAPGVYRYVPAQHALARVAGGDRAGIAAATGGQTSVSRAPLVLVFTAVMARAGERADAAVTPFVAIEVGASAENVYLQALALDLGTVAVGMIREPEMRRALALPGGARSVLAMPVGRKR